MKDEKLVRLLRLGEWGGAGDEEMVIAADRIKALESKLAKAVEALQDIFEKPRSADWTYAELISEMNKEAREALAEIKGETT